MQLPRHVKVFGIGFGKGLFSKSPFLTVFKYFFLPILAGLLVWRYAAVAERRPMTGMPKPAVVRGGPANTELRSSRPRPDAAGKVRRVSSHRTAGILKSVDSDDAGSFKDWLEDPPDLKLLFPPEFIEKILRENGNRVDLLLAAVLLSGDSGEREFKAKLLQELAAAAGDQPAVQVAMILAGNLLAGNTEGMKEWIDRLKASDPQNALANYLAASEALKRNDPTTALNELLAAGGKTDFNDYLLIDWDAREEFFRAAGYPPAESKVLAFTGMLMPHLSAFREVANSAVESAAKRQEAGDLSGALEITGSVRQLGRSLEQSAGAILINNLVGIAVETKALNLEKTIREAQNDSTGLAAVNLRLAELVTARQEIKNVAPAFDQYLKTADSAAVTAIFDRIRQYGELQTMRDLAAGKIP